jgi:uncharacterized protein (TIGR00106 family)
LVRTRKIILGNEIHESISLCIYNLVALYQVIYQKVNEEHEVKDSLRDQMIIAQLSIAPLGKGTSVSTYVKIVREILKKEHVTFQTNPMATVIETKDLTTLFHVIQKAHQAVIEAGAERIITEIKIDDRRDKEATMDSKLQSLK